MESNRITDIKKIFRKEIRKSLMIKEMFRDSCKRQIYSAPKWQIDILEEEIKKYKEGLK